MNKAIQVVEFEYISFPNLHHKSLSILNVLLLESMEQLKEGKDKKVKISIKLEIIKD